MLCGGSDAAILPIGEAAGLFIPLLDLLLFSNPSTHTSIMLQKDCALVFVLRKLYSLVCMSMFVSQ